MTSDGSLINDDGTRYNYAAVAQMLNPSQEIIWVLLVSLKSKALVLHQMEMNYSTFATVGGIAQSGTFFNDEYQLLFDNKSCHKHGKILLIMHLLMVLTMQMVV